VNYRLLYELALADTSGRRTVEQARPEENLELWRLVAEENGCFDQPYAFANHQARFMFYAGKLSNLLYTPHEDYCCTVTIMSGLPGSGKDTWLATYRPELPVVSLDELREEAEVAPTDDQGEVIQLARERCREHLRAGRHFAFNATNTIRQTRKRWVDLCADYGARIELVYLEPPLPIILEQNARRARPVPTRAIERLIDKLEPPTLTESHALTYVANSGPA
jgi:predicted kinase